MADRYDLERDRERHRDSESSRQRGEEYGRQDREREWRGGSRGDWGGSERGWEGQSRSEDWNRDRRTERGGMDQGNPPQNREEWGSRSSWGYGARGHEDWSRERERDWDRERGNRENRFESQRETPWSGENRSRVDWRGEASREGGWNEGRFGGRENWSGQGSYDQPQRRGTETYRPPDREGRESFDWDRQEHERGGRGSGGRSFEGQGWNQSSGYGGGASGTGMGAYGGGMGTYGQRGRFAGRGPKGWQRSDDRIREDINQRLTDHPDVDATNIEVQVSQGEVTLSGTVDDRQARRLAEDIAENVSGVKHVQNQIRVQQHQNLIGAGHSTPEVTGGSQTGQSSKK